jgi:hypothetical protein
MLSLQILAQNAAFPEAVESFCREVCWCSSESSVVTSKGRNSIIESLRGGEKNKGQGDSSENAETDLCKYFKSPPHCI